jgi:bla regulator protein BlaR1
MMMFLKDGKINGTKLLWTKGFIIDPIQKTASKYGIKEINGSTYLFYEWKCGDYTLRGMKPWLCVLKMIDSSDYTIIEAPRKEDRIDYPFVEDPQVLGRWVSVDSVIKPEDFKPGKTNYPASDLYSKGLNISENGNVSANFKDRTDESDILHGRRALSSASGIRPPVNTSSGK